MCQRGSVVVETIARDGNYQHRILILQKHSMQKYEKI